jgi:hypothetical protein
MLEIVLQRTILPAEVLESPSIDLITQLSIDRLDRLRPIVTYWRSRSSRVIAVILDEDRTIKDCTSELWKSRKQSAKQKVKDFEILLKSLLGSRVELILVHRSTGQTSPIPPYPINALRNIALRSSRSEYLFILDVDCIPSSDTLFSLFGTIERRNELQQICVQDCGAIVIPCFEPRSETSFLSHTLSTDASINTPSSAVPQFTTHDIRQAAQRQPLPDVVPFMYERQFDRGHRATNFSRWLRSPSNEYNNNTTLAPSTLFDHYYPIEYEEGFEPYIIVSRAFIPMYYEALESYGRNKTLHIYHLHRLGMKFWVSPFACVLHVPHAVSQDCIRIIGDLEYVNRNPTDSLIPLGPSLVSICRVGREAGALEMVKQVYEQGKAFIDATCSSWALDLTPDAQNQQQMGMYSYPIAASQRVAIFCSGVCMDDTVGTSCARWPHNITHYLGQNVSPLRLNWIDRIQTLWTRPVIETPLCDQLACLSPKALASMCSMHMHYTAPVLSLTRYTTVLMGMLDLCPTTH